VYLIFKCHFYQCLTDFKYTKNLDFSYTYYQKIEGKTSHSSQKYYSVPTNNLTTVSEIKSLLKLSVGDSIDTFYFL